MTARGKFEGKHSELTGKILGAFFQVHKELGYGLSEFELSQSYKNRGRVSA